MKTAVLTFASVGIVLSVVVSVRAENPDQVRQLLETRSCIRCDLSGANLQNRNLQGANLDGATLEGANLWRTDLRGANLANVNFQGANLGNANLQGANLRSARLNNANLNGAILEGANLFGTGLRDSNRSRSNSDWRNSDQYIRDTEQTSSEIQQLYRDMTGKSIDEFERQRWRGLDARELRRRIARSKAARDAINDIYEEVFDRPADSRGLQTWTRYLAGEGRSLSDVRRELVRSDEARSAINQVYRELLNRDADATGMRNWLEQLRRGRSISEIRDRIARSREARPR